MLPPAAAPAFSAPLSGASKHERVLSGRHLRAHFLRPRPCACARPPPPPALPAAQNQAIKLDSDDPYRVISDYLRKFAKDQDEEEEDDDDVIPEGEEPVQRPVGRRQQVVAAKLEIPEGWTPPIYEKSQADADFLENTMATNKLMKSLGEPTPTEPTPSEPTPTEPTPSEPTPTEHEQPPPAPARRDRRQQQQRPAAAVAATGGSTRSSDRRQQQQQRPAAPAAIAASPPNLLYLLSPPLLPNLLYLLSPPLPPRVRFASARLRSPPLASYLSLLQPRRTASS